MYTPCSKCHCSSGDSKIIFFFATLTDLSRSTKSPCARFLWQVLYRSGRVLRGQVRLISVTVAMNAMMRKNPTKRTLLKVTMSMMTTMTTVLHRDFENDWSSFLFSHCTICFYSGPVLCHYHSLDILNSLPSLRPSSSPPNNPTNPQA